LVSAPFLYAETNAGTARHRLRASKSRLTGLSTSDKWLGLHEEDIEVIFDIFGGISFTLLTGPRLHGIFCPSIAPPLAESTVPIVYTRSSFCKAHPQVFVCGRLQRRSTLYRHAQQHRPGLRPRCFSLRSREVLGPPRQTTTLAQTVLVRPAAPVKDSERWNEARALVLVP